MLALRELGTWVLGVALALSQVLIQFRGGSPNAYVMGAAVTLATVGLYPHAVELWRTGGRSPQRGRSRSLPRSDSEGGDDDDTPGG